MTRSSQTGSSTRDGKPRPARKAAKERRSAVLSPNTLKQLYATMLQCRMIEARARRQSQDGKLATNLRVADAQKASAVGAIIGLKAQDCVAPRRCDLVAGFILGAPLQQVFAGLQGPVASSIALPILKATPAPAPLMIQGVPSMAARLNLSAGVALAYQGQKKRGVVVAFFGEDSAALASWKEGVDFAFAHRLPIVYVVQDDLGGETNGAAHPTSLDTLAGERAMPRLVVDGNDVVAVYRVAQEAIRRAREGHGPSLIACKTHRWPGYSGIAPAPSKDAPDRNANDPIARMEGYLMQKGLWSETWKQKLMTTFRKQLNAASQFGSEAPPRATAHSKARGL